MIFVINKSPRYCCTGIISINRLNKEKTTDACVCLCFSSSNNRKSAVFYCVPRAAPPIDRTCLQLTAREMKCPGVTYHKYCRLKNIPITHSRSSGQRKRTFLYSSRSVFPFTVLFGEIEKSINHRYLIVTCNGLWQIHLTQTQALKTKLRSGNIYYTNLIDRLGYVYPYIIRLWHEL